MGTACYYRSQRFHNSSFVVDHWSSSSGHILALYCFVGTDWDSQRQKAVAELVGMVDSSCFHSFVADSVGNTPVLLLSFDSQGREGKSHQVEVVCRTRVAHKVHR